MARTRWWRRIATVPGIAAATALTATVSWLATQMLGSLRTRVESREPLSLVVRDNPGRIGAFNDQPIYGAIPADVETTGSPGSGCTGFHDWLKLNKGVDAGATKLQLIVQGKVSKPILLSEMRVKVLQVMPPVKGIPVSCPTAGEANIRGIEIDLDAKLPRATYQDGNRPFGFTVQAGETETFNIVAKTARGHYKWVIDLDVVIEGDQRTIEIVGPGGPFETTARSSTGNWEWDFQAGWSAPADRPRRVPERVAAGKPLPVLN